LEEEHGDHASLLFLPKLSQASVFVKAPWVTLWRKFVEGNRMGQEDLRTDILRTGFGVGLDHISMF
jgi:hypothetical protein